MKTKTIDRPFQVKSLSEDGTFTGYASVFGEIDSYRDIVMPGAFAKSLAKHAAKGRKVPILWQHRSAEPIGVHTAMQEDGIGLFIAGKLTRGVQRADEAYLLMKDDALSGISIGYNTAPGGSEYDAKNDVLKLTEVDLWENSLVTFPALDSARVDSVKSLGELTTIRECEAWLRDAHGLSPKEAIGFISRVKSASSPRDSVDAKLQKSLDSIKNSLSKLD